MGIAATPAPTTRAAHATQAPSVQPRTRASTKKQTQARVPLSNRTNVPGLPPSTGKAKAKTETPSLFNDLGKLFTDAAAAIFDDVAATTRRAAAAAAEVVVNAKPSVFEAVPEETEREAEVAAAKDATPQQQTATAAPTTAAKPTTRSASAAAAMAAADTAAAGAGEKPTGAAAAAPPPATGRRAAMERQQAEDARMKVEEEKVGGKEGTQAICVCSRRLQLAPPVPAHSLPMLTSDATLVPLPCPLYPFCRRPLRHAAARSEATRRGACEAEG